MPVCVNVVNVSHEMNRSKNGIDVMWLMLQKVIQQKAVDTAIENEREKKMESWWVI